MTSPSAVYSEEGIGVTLHRVTIGIHVHEDFPELEARVHGESTEDSIQSNAWTVSHLSKCPSCTVRSDPCESGESTYGTEKGPRISVVIK